MILDLSVGCNLGVQLHRQPLHLPHSPCHFSSSYILEVILLHLRKSHPAKFHLSPENGAGVDRRPIEAHPFYTLDCEYSDEISLVGPGFRETSFDRTIRFAAKVTLTSRENRTDLSANDILARSLSLPVDFVLV